MGIKQMFIFLTLIFFTSLSSVEIFSASEDSLDDYERRRCQGVVEREFEQIIFNSERSCFRENFNLSEEEGREKFFLSTLTGMDLAYELIKGKERKGDYGLEDPMRSKDLFIEKISFKEGRSSGMEEIVRSLLSSFPKKVFKEHDLRDLLEKTAITLPPSSLFKKEREMGKKREDAKIINLYKMIKLAKRVAKEGETLSHSKAYDFSEEAERKYIDGIFLLQSSRCEDLLESFHLLREAFYLSPNASFQQKEMALSLLSLYEKYELGRGGFLFRILGKQEIVEEKNRLP